MEHSTLAIEGSHDETPFMGDTGGRTDGEGDPDGRTDGEGDPGGRTDGEGDPGGRTDGGGVPGGVSVKVWDDREIEVIHRHAKSPPNRNTITDILAELSHLDLQVQHSKRAVLHRFNKAREIAVKEQLKTENEMLKEQIVELKDAKDKIEELLLEKYRSANYLGRSGLKRLIKNRSQSRIMRPQRKLLSNMTVWNKLYWT